ncbi:putative orphan protein [Pseudoalteromonas translucida]|uniref:Orphan protein n=1 Tax=Pseudoalteromonas translucida (strain TAC 125) TaxID=326442 RepID=Q3IFT0_PSET1|nr:putative orphan protein [Pseudoalteromonas translucida]
MLKNIVIVAAVIAHNKRESQRIAGIRRVLGCDNSISLSISYFASVHQIIKSPNADKLKCRNIICETQNATQTRGSYSLT